MQQIVQADSLPKIRGTYRFNFSLASITWFAVGGEADVLFKPQDQDDLIYFLKNKPKDLKYFVLGVGSNLLIRDGGFRGAVIRLGKEFSKIEQLEDQLIVGAGALDLNVSLFAAENEIEGLEFLSGIPGVIGAALAMNAGAYGKEISDVLIRAEAIDEEGKLHILDKEEFGFIYRGNSLQKKYIFTKAYLKAKKGNALEIKERLDAIRKQREATQPIRSKTGGSSFKNPPGYKAWELIDQAGCRGLSIGDAEISTKHCNFLINKGNASAAQIEELGELVRKRVYDNSGINLEWEIKIIGEK